MPDSRTILNLTVFSHLSQIKTISFDLAYTLFSHLTWSSHVHLILYTWFPSHKTFFCFPWSLELLCNNFAPAWSMSSVEGASYLTIVFFLVFNFFTPSPVYISIHALIFFTFVKGYSIIAESSYFENFFNQRTFFFLIFTFFTMCTLFKFRFCRAFLQQAFGSGD